MDRKKALGLKTTKQTPEGENGQEKSTRNFVKDIGTH